MDIIFENFLFKNIYRLLASRFSELSLSKLVLFIFSLLLTKITTKKVSFRFIKIFVECKQKAKINLETIFIQV